MTQGDAANGRPFWSLLVMGEGICPGLPLGGRGGWGTSHGGTGWVRGAEGPCIVCSLHGVVSDGELLAGHCLSGWLRGADDGPCWCWERWVGALCLLLWVRFDDPPFAFICRVDDATAFLFSSSYLIAE